jgi:hypothetical protein
MKTIPMLFLFFALSVSLSGQKCAFYFPSETGKRLTYNMLDKKEKLIGMKYLEVAKKIEKDETTILLVNVKLKDKKERLVQETQHSYECENGVFYFDMKNFVASSYNESNENTNIMVQGSNLAYPNDMKVGDDLPDASVEVRIESQGMTLNEFSIFIENRKVEKKEEIETPAGTFNCYKITYTNMVEGIRTSETKSISWLAEGIGYIKTENYSEKDKLLGSEVLTEVK